MPDYTSLMVAVPEKKVSIAILLADGNKNVIVSRIDRAACSFPIEAVRRSRSGSKSGTSSGQTATNSPFSSTMQG